ncbi:MAG: hypothetical protein U0441_25150 [Polyangiaceae bacterium]
MAANVVGKPVRGGDFFNRSREINDMWSRLETDNILLLAPRRVGKTSLMYRLLDGAAERQFLPTYVSVADAPNELAFAQKLYDCVKDHKPARKVIAAIAKSPLGRLFKSVKKVGLFGASVELGEQAEQQWAQLSEALLSAFGRGPERWLLLIDELPIFVLSLLKQDPTGNRARHFLNWFRNVRTDMKSGDHVRWLLAGSIGLDTVARRRNLGDTINDLYVYTDFGAFSPDTADALLQDLAASAKIALSPEVRSRICQRAGWLIPYHLQLLFSEIRKGFLRTLTQPTVEDVDAAYESLMDPAHRAYFDYWKQRLHEELGPPEDGQAVEILHAAAKDPSGVTRSTLLGVLSRHVQEPREREARLHELLDVLRSDGYLIEHEGRVAFRSSMLRDFWLRRVMP